MPVAPSPSDPDATVYIQVRAPGWLKNAVLERCLEDGISINTFAVRALKDELEAKRAPERHGETPTIADVLRDYVAGKPTIAPCGKSWPCAGAGQTTRLAGQMWCDVCGVRTGS